MTDEHGDVHRNEPSDAVDWELVPLEVLEVQLSGWAAHVAAAEASWLKWLAVYDRREGWVVWGCKSAAHWLSWKCGISPGAGREKVRVARALESMPIVAAEFGAGRLSYSKVRALTRVVNEFNEADLVAMALTASGAQLEAICRGHQRTGIDQKAEAAAAFAGRDIRFRDNSNGTTSIVITVPNDAAAKVRSAIYAAAGQVVADAAVKQRDPREAELTRRQVITERGGLGAIRSDAAVALLIRPDQAVGDASNSTTTNPDEVALIVQQAPPIPDENVPAGTPASGPDAWVEAQINGQAIGPAAALRLSCDPRITAIVEDSGGHQIGIGRTSRQIPNRIRRALDRRDHRTCRFPGCDASQHLHAHHVIHWVNGGETDLENLMLLCHFHHHLVHDGGWNIEPATHQFVDPTGAPINETPDTTRSRGNADLVTAAAPATASPSSLEPENYGPLDLPWTTAILRDNETLRSGLP